MYRKLQRAIEQVRENILIYLAVFIVGSFISSWSVYYDISQDCRVLGAFRLGNVAFHCQVSKS